MIVRDGTGDLVVKRHATWGMSVQIAQRVRGHLRLRVWAGSKHQCSGHVSSPDFQAALHRAEQRVRIGIRIGRLKFAEELTPGL